jgi:hypothetical protein
VQNILIREKLIFTEPVTVLIGIHENREEDFILSEFTEVDLLLMQKERRD